MLDWSLYPLPGCILKPNSVPLSPSMTRMLLKVENLALDSMSVKLEVELGGVGNNEDKTRLWGKSSVMISVSL